MSGFAEDEKFHWNGEQHRELFLETMSAPCFTRVHQKGLTKVRNVVSGPEWVKWAMETVVHHGSGKPLTVTETIELGMSFVDVGAFVPLSSGGTKELVDEKALYRLSSVEVFARKDVEMEFSSREGFEAFMNVLRDPERGVAVGKRKYHLKAYSNVFVGSELVDWVLQRVRRVWRRSDALAVCNFLYDLSLFQHVVREHTMEDNFIFYRFTEPAPPVEIFDNFLAPREPPASSEIVQLLGSGALDFVRTRRDGTKVFSACLLVDHLVRHYLLLRSQAVVQLNTLVAMGYIGGFNAESHFVDHHMAYYYVELGVEVDLTVFSVYLCFESEQELLSTRRVFLSPRKRQAFVPHEALVVRRRTPPSDYVEPPSSPTAVWGVAVLARPAYLRLSRAADDGEASDAAGAPDGVRLYVSLGETFDTRTRVMTIGEAARSFGALPAATCAPALAVAGAQRIQRALEVQNLLKRPRRAGAADARDHGAQALTKYQGSRLLRSMSHSMEAQWSSRELGRNGDELWDSNALSAMSTQSTMSLLDVSTSSMVSLNANKEAGETDALAEGKEGLPNMRVRSASALIRKEVYKCEQDDRSVDDDGRGDGKDGVEEEEPGSAGPVLRSASAAQLGRGGGSGSGGKKYKEKKEKEKKEKKKKKKSSDENEADEEHEGGGSGKKSKRGDGDGTTSASASADDAGNGVVPTRILSDSDGDDDTAGSRTPPSSAAASFDEDEGARRSSLQSCSGDLLGVDESMIGSGIVIPFASVSVSTRHRESAAAAAAPGDGSSDALIAVLTEDASARSLIDSLCRDEIEPGVDMRVPGTSDEYRLGLSRALMDDDRVMDAWLGTLLSRLGEPRAAFPRFFRHCVRTVVRSSIDDNNIARSSETVDAYVVRRCLDIYLRPFAHLVTTDAVVAVLKFGARLTELKRAEGLEAAAEQERLLWARATQDILQAMEDHLRLLSPIVAFLLRVYEEELREARPGVFENIAGAVLFLRGVAPLLVRPAAEGIVNRELAKDEHKALINFSREFIRVVNAREEPRLPRIYQAVVTAAPDEPTDPVYPFHISTANIAAFNNLLFNRLGRVEAAAKASPPEYSQILMIHKAVKKHFKVLAQSNFGPGKDYTNLIS